MGWTYTDAEGEVIIRDGEVSGEYLCKEYEEEREVADAD